MRDLLYCSDDSQVRKLVVKFRRLPLRKVFLLFACESCATPILRQESGRILFCPENLILIVILLLITANQLFLFPSLY